MATLTHNDIAQAIYLALKGKEGKDLSDVCSGTIKFLSRKKLISKTSDILKKLEAIANTEAGVVVAKISTIKKLDEQTKSQINTEILRRYKAKKVVFVEVINEKLLGGIKIEVDDEVIDLTILNKLKKLQEHLTR